MNCMYVYTCSSEVCKAYNPDEVCKAYNPDEVCKAYNPDVNELHEVIYEEFDQGTYDGLYS